MSKENRTFPTPAASRELIAERLQRLFYQLTQQLILTQEDLQGSVHKTRKLTKEIRANLKLLRQHIPENYPVAKGSLQKIAHYLGPFRDQHVMNDIMSTTFSEASGGMPALVTVGMTSAVVQVTDVRSSAATDGGVEEDEASQKMRIRRQLTRWLIELTVWQQALLQELRDSQLSAKWLVKKFDKQCVRVANSAKGRIAHYDAEARHDSRKALKGLMYNLKLLRPEWSETHHKRYKKLQKITECLGDANDLALILEDLTRSSSVYFAGLSEDERATYLKLIQGKQRKLWKKADRITEKSLLKRPRVYPALKYPSVSY